MDTRIRNATPLDLPSLLDFTRSVGRSVSADEIKTWLQVDPEAFFVAETLPDGKLIGTCCGTRLTPELGFMGLYMVLEEYRGKGIGMKLWKAARDHLGDRNIGVCGNPDNFKKYTEKEGFSHMEDYAILFYDCFGDSMETNITPSTDIELATYFEGNLISYSKHLSLDASSGDERESDDGSRKTDSYSKTAGSERNVTLNTECNENNLIEEKQYESGILFSSNSSDESPLTIVCTENTSIPKARDGLSSAEQQIKSNIVMDKSSIEFRKSTFNSINSNAEKNLKTEEILSGIFAFDQLIHRRDRSLIVRNTFAWSSCRSKVALVGGKVVGYACLRDVVTQHWSISPFYAETEEIAEILLFELLRGFNFSLAPEGIQIRFPDKNIACKKLVEKFGFREKAVRLLTGFTKRSMNIDTSKIYSFHSIAFCSD